VYGCDERGKGNERKGKKKERRERIKVASSFLLERSSGIPCAFGGSPRQGDFGFGTALP